MKEKKKNNYFRYITLLCMCIIGLLYCILHRNDGGTSIQQGIAKEVIRFHVIANSDDKVDQKVKLEVKDVLVKYMQKKLRNVNSKAEAKKVMKQEMPEIKALADKTLRKKGYQYSCDVTYHKRIFPVKLYGDLTFPAGEYEALDVVLGNAKGKNWWCVMFPTLCFVDGTYSVVPDDSKKLLKNVLTDAEYNEISEEKGISIEYTLKIAEWWNQIKDQVVKIVE
ncbi:MAG: stage II sporulation protein R [Clostridium sp.]|nr:stage II sporulation protein R [Clostridium sp.]